MAEVSQSHSTITAAFALLEAFPFPASLTNRANRFMAVNHAFMRHYKRPVDGLLGRSPRLLTPDDYSETLLRELDQATATGGWAGRLTNCDALGRRFEIALRTLPVARSEGTCFLGVACRPGEEDALQRALLAALWQANATVAAEANPSPALSAREWQIHGRLRAGQTYKEIAYDLELATVTVRVLAMRLRSKLRHGVAAKHLGLPSNCRLGAQWVSVGFVLKVNRREVADGRVAATEVVEGLDPLEGG
ncbi:MAG: hypothetical protein JNG82_12460, partial [Opitutaceae bacterium]|nr:hypothetical protein [Opitutaceae bacterium]